MATQTDTALDPLTIDELKQRARSIADALTEAARLVDQAGDDAKYLINRQDAGREYLERFDYEVFLVVRGIACDLGVDIGAEWHGDTVRGNFDIDTTPRDARDLVDLIDFAATERTAA